jgi:hypothetical protein
VSISYFLAVSLRGWIDGVDGLLLTLVISSNILFFSLQYNLLTLSNMW